MSIKSRSLLSLVVSDNYGSSTDKETIIFQKSLNKNNVSDIIGKLHSLKDPNSLFKKKNTEKILFNETENTSTIIESKSLERKIIKSLKNERYNTTKELFIKRLNNLYESKDINNKFTIKNYNNIISYLKIPYHFNNYKFEENTFKEIFFIKNKKPLYHLIKNLSKNIINVEYGDNKFFYNLVINKKNNITNKIYNNLNNYELNTINIITSFDSKKSSNYFNDKLNFIYKNANSSEGKILIKKIYDISNEIDEPYQNKSKMNTSIIFINDKNYLKSRLNNNESNIKVQSDKFDILFNNFNKFAYEYITFGKNKDKEIYDKKIGYMFAYRNIIEGILLKNKIKKCRIRLIKKGLSNILGLNFDLTGSTSLLSEKLSIIENIGQLIDITYIIINWPGLIGHLAELDKFLKKVVGYISIVIDYTGDGGGTLIPEDPTKPPEPEKPEIKIINGGFNDVNLALNPNTYFKIKLGLPENTTISKVINVPKGMEFNIAKATLEGYYMSPTPQSIIITIGDKQFYINITASKLSQYLI